MKMYRVFVEDREYFVGKIEMEYLVLVFGEKAKVEIIELQEQSGAHILMGDD